MDDNREVPENRAENGSHYEKPHGITVPTKTVAAVLISFLVASGSLFIDTFVLENNTKLGEVSDHLDIVGDQVESLQREIKFCRDNRDRLQAAVDKIERDMKEHAQGNSKLRDKVWEFQAKKNAEDSHQTKLIERCMYITGVRPQ